MPYFTLRRHDDSQPGFADYLVPRCLTTPSESSKHIRTNTCARKHTFLDQVAWQQKVGDSFADGVLVPAAGAHELALHHLRLHEQAVQVRQRLVVHGLLILLVAAAAATTTSRAADLEQFLLCRRLRGQGRESELRGEN